MRSPQIWQRDLAKPACWPHSSTNAPHPACPLPSLQSALVEGAQLDKAEKEEL